MTEQPSQKTRTIWAVVAIASILVFVGTAVWVIYFDPVIEGTLLYWLSPRRCVIRDNDGVDHHISLPYIKAISPIIPIIDFREILNDKVPMGTPIYYEQPKPWARLEGTSGDVRIGYLYATIDGENELVNVNVLIVRYGYAEYDNSKGRCPKYDKEFTEAEEYAKKNKLGIWGE
ncbi:thermonuclease family protein [Planctomycetota bacterium]